MKVTNGLFQLDLLPKLTKSRWRSPTITTRWLQTWLTQTADVITTRCTFRYHTSPCSHQGKLPLPPPLPFCIRVISPLIFLYKNYKFCWIQRDLDKIQIWLHVVSVLGLRFSLTPHLVLGGVPSRPTNNWTCQITKHFKIIQRQNRKCNNPTH